jgi:hypothetical protein
MRRILTKAIVLLALALVPWLMAARPASAQGTPENPEPAGPRVALADPIVQRNLLESWRATGQKFLDMVAEYKRLLGESPTPGSSAGRRLRELARTLQSWARSLTDNFESTSHANPEIQGELSAISKPWETFEPDETLKALAREAGEGFKGFPEGAATGEPLTPTAQQGAGRAQEGSPTAKQGAQPAQEGQPANPQEGISRANQVLILGAAAAVQLVSCLDLGGKTFNQCVLEAGLTAAEGAIIAAAATAAGLSVPAMIVAGGFAAVQVGSEAVQQVRDYLDRRNVERARQEQQQKNLARLGETVAKLQQQLDGPIAALRAQIAEAEARTRDAAGSAATAATAADALFTQLRGLEQPIAEATWRCTRDVPDLTARIGKAAPTAKQSAELAETNFEDARTRAQRCASRQELGIAELSYLDGKGLLPAVASNYEDARVAVDGLNAVSAQVEQGKVALAQAAKIVQDIGDKALPAQGKADDARSEAKQAADLFADLKAKKAALLTQIKTIRDSFPADTVEVDQRLAPIIARLTAEEDLPVVNAFVAQANKESSRAEEIRKRGEGLLQRFKSPPLCTVAPQDDALDEARLAVLSLDAHGMGRGLPEQFAECRASLDTPSSVASSTTTIDAPRPATDPLTQADEQIKREDAEQARRRQAVTVSPPPTVGGSQPDQPRQGVDRAAQVARARCSSPNTEPFWDETRGQVMCRCIPGHRRNADGPGCVPAADSGTTATRAPRPAPAPPPPRPDSDDPFYGDLRNTPRDRAAVPPPPPRPDDDGGVGDLIGGFVKGFTEGMRDGSPRSTTGSTVEPPRPRPATAPPPQQHARTSATPPPAPSGPTWLVWLASALRTTDREYQKYPECRVQVVAGSTEYNPSMERAVQDQLNRLRADHYANVEARYFKTKQDADRYVADVKPRMQADAQRCTMAQRTKR